jgi:hypothetical protein
MAKQLNEMHLSHQQDRTAHGQGQDMLLDRLAAATLQAEDAMQAQASGQASSVYGLAMDRFETKTEQLWLLKHQQEKDSGAGGLSSRARASQQT